MVLVVVLLVVALVAAVLAAVAWRRAAAALSAAQAEITRLEQAVTAVLGERDTVTAERDDARAERDDAAAALAEATTTNEQLQRSRADAEERAATLASALAAAHAGGHDPETLWALELARVQRRWREAVAPNPLDPPPDPGPDPLRYAVSVVAAALREEAGTAVALDWVLDRLPPPGARVTVLRVAEELLAAGAKVLEQGTMAVGADGDDVLVVLAGLDEEGQRATPPVPSLAGHAAVELVAAPGSVTARVKGALAESA